MPGSYRSSRSRAVSSVVRMRSALRRNRIRMLGRWARLVNSARRARTRRGLLSAVRSLPSVSYTGRRRRRFL